MTRITVLFICLLLTNFTFSQIFHTEDFETNGNSTRYFPEVENIDGQNIFFARTQNSDHSANFSNDYSGESGSYYWAGEDYDGPQVDGSGNQELELLLNNIDISGRTNTKRVFRVKLPNDVNIESLEVFNLSRKLVKEIKHSGLFTGSILNVADLTISIYKLE